MVKFINKLLAEHSDLSAVRFMGILALLIGGIIAAYGLHKGSDLVGLAALVSAFVTPAFAAKVWQKSLEASAPKE